MLTARQDAGDTDRQIERQGKRGRQIVQERRTRKSKPEALHKERERVSL